MKYLYKLWQKLRFWYWGNFRATENQKAKWDLITKGVTFMKAGKIHIDPSNFLIEEYEHYTPSNRTRDKANDFADSVVYSYSKRTPSSKDV